MSFVIKEGVVYEYEGEKITSEEVYYTLIWCNEKIYGLTAHQLADALIARQIKPENLSYLG